MRALAFWEENIGKLLYWEVAPHAVQDRLGAREALHHIRLTRHCPSRGGPPFRDPGTVVPRPSLVKSRLKLFTCADRGHFAFRNHSCRGCVKWWCLIHCRRSTSSLSHILVGCRILGKYWSLVGKLLYWNRNLSSQGQFLERFCVPLIAVIGLCKALFLYYVSRTWLDTPMSSKIWGRSKFSNRESVTRKDGVFYSVGSSFSVD